MRTRDNRFDRDNVAEEVEELGRDCRDAVRSRVRRILVHLLKLAYSPAGDPRFDWMASIIDARAELDDKLSPSLRRDSEEALPRLYAIARKRVALDLSKYGEHEAARSVPVECPFTIAQVLEEDWYPAPREPMNKPE